MGRHTHIKIPNKANAQLMRTRRIGPFGRGGGVPLENTAITISGLTAIGSTLTATPGSWFSDTEPSVTFAWFSGVTQVGTGLTYVTQIGDSLADMTCQETAQNSAGSSAPVTSNTITMDAA